MSPSEDPSPPAHGPEPRPSDANSRDQIPPTSGAPLSLLIAIAEDDLTPSILAFASALERLKNARPTVFSGFDTSAYPTPPAFATVVALGEALLGPNFQEQRKDRLRKRIDATLGTPTKWPIEIAVGPAATCIAEVTKRMRPDLLVMGLHHHHGLDRALGEDTVRNVLHRVPIPVLALRPPLADLPRYVMAAVDFSRASLRAAHMAARLVKDGGILDLVYVRSSFLTGVSGATEDDEGLASILETGIDASFDQFATQLETSVQTHVKKTVLSGDTVSELKRYAARVAPDLITIGRHQRRPLSRVFIGSVALAIARDSRWSVLIMPPGGDTSPSNPHSVHSEDRSNAPE